MDRFRKDRDILNSWVQLDDFDRYFIISDHADKDTQITLKEINDYKKKRAKETKSTKDRADRIWKWVNAQLFGPVVDIPNNFNGLSHVYGTRK